MIYNDSGNVENEEEQVVALGDPGEPEPEQTPHEQYMEGITQITDEDYDQMFGTSGVVEQGEQEDFSDLTSLDEEDEADLVDVDMDDIMGEESTPEPTPQKSLRAAKPTSRIHRQVPSPPSLGGVQGA